MCAQEHESVDLCESVRYPSGLHSVYMGGSGQHISGGLLPGSQCNHTLRSAAVSQDDTFGHAKQHTVTGETKNRACMLVQHGCLSSDPFSSHCTSALDRHASIHKHTSAHAHRTCACICMTAAFVLVWCARLRKHLVCLLLCSSSGVVKVTRPAAKMLLCR